MSDKGAMGELKKAGAGIDDALKKMLAEHRTGAPAQMYEMLAYFFGFLDADLKQTNSESSGKRFRPSLSLLIAEGYGAKEKAFDAALSIELFHNFTLIHDDVEDRDEYRRNKPTLWKLFGINHAINAGDALSLVASEKAAQTELSVRKILFAAFSEVIEGQYLDFELTSKSLNSEEVSVACCMESTEKKTGALIGAAAEVAGACAAQNESECAQLRAYGRALGIAFQLADDFRSIWSTQKETGKDEYGDIREHKRTLPFFFAYEKTSEKTRLAELYSLERQLSESEISEVWNIIDATSARARVLKEIQMHADRAREAAAKLSLPQNMRDTLAQLIDELVPEAEP